MLTEEQIAHYYREGYVLVRALVPVQSVAAVMDAAPKEAAAGGEWQAHIFDFEEPIRNAALHRLLVEPPIIEAVTDIFATPPRLYYGMLAVVPAHGGNGLAWHQDNQYDPVYGGALNVFVALSEITPDKAILWVAPRSHLSGIQPSKAQPGHREMLVEPENGQPLPEMYPGDVCLFDRNTVHRSLKNDTDTDRFAYAAQYCSQNARQASTGTLPSGKMLAAELRDEWQEGVFG